MLFLDGASPKKTHLCTKKINKGDNANGEAWTTAVVQASPFALSPLLKLPYIELLKRIILT